MKIAHEPHESRENHFVCFARPPDGVSGRAGVFRGKKKATAFGGGRLQVGTEFMRKKEMIGQTMSHYTILEKLDEGGSVPDLCRPKPTSVGEGRSIMHVTLEVI